MLAPSDLGRERWLPKFEALMFKCHLFDIMGDKDLPLSRLSAPVLRTGIYSGAKNQTSADLSRHSARSDLTRESLQAYLEQRSPALERTSIYRANQELARRAAHPLQCSITLSFKDVKTGEGIHYKFDGQRFKHSDASVKFVSGTTYQVNLSLRPEMDLVPNILQIQSSLPEGGRQQNVIALHKDRIEGKKLEGQWKCELEPNQKNKRVEMMLNGQLEHFGAFSVPLLAKIYDPNGKGAMSGFKLKMVVYEVRRSEGIQSGIVQLSSVRYMN